MALFEQGDIVEVNFNPSVGHEPAKRRPGLIVSTGEFNMRSSLTFVAPITSTVNRYPLHYYIESDEADVRGCVCVEQTRAMDLSARPCRKIGEVGADDMGEVLSLLGAIFGI